jgi:hypothetical protein
MIELFYQWYFLEVPAKIKRIWGNYLWFFAKYFAIVDLSRQFLAPWKGLVFKREKRGFENRLNLQKSRPLYIPGDNRKSPLPRPS